MVVKIAQHLKHYFRIKSNRTDRTTLVANAFRSLSLYQNFHVTISLKIFFSTQPIINHYTDFFYHYSI